MKLHLCGIIAASILLTGCGQMGPLILPSQAVAPQAKAKAKAPAASGTETPASSGVTTAPAARLEPIQEAPAEPVKGNP